MMVVLTGPGGVTQIPPWAGRQVCVPGAVPLRFEREFPNSGEMASLDWRSRLSLAINSQNKIAILAACTASESGEAGVRLTAFFSSPTAITAEAAAEVMITSYPEGLVYAAAKMMIGAYSCAEEGVQMEPIAGRVLRGFLELGRKGKLIWHEGGEPLTEVSSIGPLMMDAIGFAYKALGIPLEEGTPLVTFYNAGNKPLSPNPF